ncbi:MAG: hypothetical protein CM1200mP24_07930 [Gammaproteobacteria bacterium]|nr:MAG: hypothetical protein CM1200mP24_07930 [Gammaproteobacteria bacterium]
MSISLGKRHPYSKHSQSTVYCHPEERFIRPPFCFCLLKKGVFFPIELNGPEPHSPRCNIPFPSKSRLAFSKSVVGVLVSYAYESSLHRQGVHSNLPSIKDPLNQGKML